VLPGAAAGSRPLTVVFLCTANACRSQMGEAWARHLFGAAGVAAFSAGVAPGARVDPNAIVAMGEVGIDMGGASNKAIQVVVSALRSLPRNASGNHQPDLVVTVCDNAATECPSFPGRAGRQVHAPFPDPPAIARGAGIADVTSAEALPHYRAVRDAIGAWVQRELPLLLPSLADKAPSAATAVEP
jgi:arsenate reductase